VYETLLVDTCWPADDPPVCTETDTQTHTKLRTFIIIAAIKMARLGALYNMLKYRRHDKT